MATILYIEDNPDNMLFVKRALEARGHHFVWAESGAHGVSLARALAPDLILLNVDLPAADGADGCAIAERLRNTARAPIIALTANVFGSAQRTRAAGCGAHVLQPVSLRDLWKYIDAAMP
jgi:CheY-like chemotaxis protein